jgi:hypothetical protein
MRFFFLIFIMWLCSSNFICVPYNFFLYYILYLFKLIGTLLQILH